MTKLAFRVAWLVPLVLFCEDALAWGLCTHVYFSQLLIWAVPLADTRFRRAITRLPRLMLAGACLPDVALFSRLAGAPELGTTHQWSAARRMLERAQDDEARALAVGYASHLLCDVVAHNHFVPAHEQMWLDRPVVTHAAAEWMMDAHVMPQLFHRPADLMRQHRRRLVECAVTELGCDRDRTQRALSWLTSGERLLRASRLPQALRRGACLFDPRLLRRLDWYVGETTARLGQINRLVEGDAPVLHPEIACALPPRTRRHLQPRGLVSELPVPQDFF